MRKLVVSTLLFLLSVIAGAATWHVKTSGNDSNSGQTWATAKRTLGAALAVAQRGDSIWVAGGIYNEKVTVGSAIFLYGGFAGTETTLSQRVLGPTPTIMDGGGSGTVVQMSGSGTLPPSIDGFTVRNAQNGVASSFQGTVVSNVRAEDMSGDGENGGLGIATTNNSLIRNSFATRCTTGIAPRGSTVRNCVLWGNTFGVYVYSSWFRLENSTLVENQIASQASWASPTYRNNIVAYNAAGLVAHHSAGPDTGDCLFWGNVDHGSAAMIGQNGNFVGDPMFVNVFSGDYHVQPGSAAIDAGDNQWVQPGDLDMDLQPRINGSAVDIGADESYGTTHGGGPTPIRIYVKPNGDDSADGLSWASAKASLHAALVAAERGDSIWVAGGIYNEKVTVGSAIFLYGGFAGTETTLSQRVLGPTPTIMDGGGSGTVILMTGSGTLAPSIDGFTVRNATNGVTSSFQGTLVSSVRAEDMTGDGENSGFGVSTVSNSLVRNSFATRCTVGVAPRGSTVRNCVLWNNGYGVLTYSAGFLLENSTLVENQVGAYATWSSPAYRNNIFAYNASGISLHHSANLNTQNCLFFGNVDNGSGAGIGQNGNFVGDPMFVNVFSGDYHVQPGSAAIDAGDNQWVQLGDLDMDLQPRINGSAVDIGADESYGGSSNRPPVIDPIADRVVNLGITVNLTVTANDPDGNTVTFSLLPPTHGGTIGTSNGNFTWTPTVPGTFEFTVRATDNGTPNLSATRAFAVTVLPSELASVFVTPNSVVSGAQSVVGTVTLTGVAPAGGLTINLSSSNATVASVDTQVTVPAGQSSVNFAVVTFPVATQRTATITATQGAIQRQTTLTVNPPSLASFTILLQPVVPGQSTSGYILTTGTAPAGGWEYMVTSSHPSLVSVPATITVPGNDSQVTFPIQTHAGDPGAVVTITVSRPGDTLSADLSFFSIQAPPSLAPQAISSGTVVVSKPLDTDVTAALSTSNSNLTIPSSVTILAGQTSATFPITAGAGTGPTTITATLPPPINQQATAVVVVSGDPWVEGTATMNGRANLQGVAAVLQLRNPSTGAVVATYPTTLGAGGTFAVQVSQSGTFDLALKLPTSLRRKVSGVVINPATGATGVSFALTNGDVNGDNAVSIADFLQLRAAYGSSTGSGTWNPNADLNGDGSVGLADFLILRAAFGRSGD